MEVINELLNTTEAQQMAFIKKIEVRDSMLMTMQPSWSGRGNRISVLWLPGSYIFSHLYMREYYLPVRRELLLS